MATSFSRRMAGQGAGDETLARIAHLYYVLGLTQSEIAKRLNVNRFKVHRSLAQARARGMVRIQIDVPFAARLELESALINRFSLDAAFVCPSDTSEEISLSEVVGHYAASVASGLLENGMTVATSWGSTLRALATAIEPGAAQDLSVISMIGSLTTRSIQDKFEAVSVLAERLGAECFHIPAPIICDTVAAKTAINDQPAVREAMERARAADVAFISIGGHEMSSMREASMLSDEDYAEAVRAGAIGNFIGRFVGRDGRPLRHELNDRCVGIGPEEIMEIPRRVLCAGGENKIDVMRAVLDLGAATVLVTDDRTAQALLAA